MRILNSLISLKVIPFDSGHCIFACILFIFSIIFHIYLPLEHWFHWILAAISFASFYNIYGSDPGYLPVILENSIHVNTCDLEANLQEILDDENTDISMMGCLESYQYKRVHHIYPIHDPSLCRTPAGATEKSMYDSIPCKRCNILAPLRSHHCNICRRCVATFDHHCGIIGTCIGERNHKRFAIFLFVHVSFFGMQRL